LFFMASFYITIIVIVNKIKKASRRRKYIASFSIDTSSMMVDDQLNADVYELYKQINIAWMNKDLEPIRHLLTDELYNMYLMQVDTLVEQQHTNIMSDFRFISGHIKSRRTYRGKETIVMLFNVQCRDYIVDIHNKVVRGNRREICNYMYELKLVRNVVKKDIICPSCGYHFREDEGVKCPYCETVVHQNSNELRLADKKVVYQTWKRG